MLYCDYDTYSAMGGTMSAEPVSYTHLAEFVIGRCSGDIQGVQKTVGLAC